MKYVVRWMCAHAHSLVLVWIWATILVLGGGCELAPPPPITSSFGANTGGSEALVLELPFATESRHLCTQGAHGSFSHHGRSVEFDLDLDTDNSTDESLFAPVSGVAYTHLESRTQGFGYHINIDVGQGKYVVLAHLKDVLVTSGESVVAGQLIAIEGCTGLCSGDHVHIGLHMGDARVSAGRGVSVPVAYRVRGSDGSDTIHTSEEMKCGIETGTHYRSTLSIPYAHPSGTLVKTHGAPRVYLTDGRYLDWIEDETIFRTMRYSFADVVTISEEEFRCYERGGSFSDVHPLSLMAGEDYRVWLVLWYKGRFERRQVPDGFEDTFIKSWGFGEYWPEQVELISKSASVWENVPEGDDLLWMRPGTIVEYKEDLRVFVATDSHLMELTSKEVVRWLGLEGRRAAQVNDRWVETFRDRIGSCADGWICSHAEDFARCGEWPTEPDPLTSDTSHDLPNTTEHPPSDTQEIETSPFWEERPSDEDRERHERSVGRERSSSPFVLIYTPLEDWPFESAEIYAQIVDRTDRVRRPFARVVRGRIGQDSLVWTADDVEPGDQIHLTVELVDVGQETLAMNQSGELVGLLSLFFEGEPLSYALHSRGVTAAIVPTPQTDTQADALQIMWDAPRGERMRSIALSAEVTRRGSIIRDWQTIVSVRDQDSLMAELADIQSGDQVRFSVEFETQHGERGWSCIGPYPDHYRTQGAWSIRHQERDLEPYVTGDPSGETTGCGFTVDVP